MASNPPHELRARRHATARGFLDAHEQSLLRNEARYNSMISQARGAARAETPRESWCFYGVESGDGQPVGQAIWVHADRPLTISRMSSSVLELLARQIHEDAVPLPGIRGPEPSAREFADLWSTLTGCEVRLSMADRLYEARAITIPSQDRGKLVMAGAEQRGIVRTWFEAFLREAISGEPIDPDALDRRTNRLCDEGRVALWRDETDEWSSMAARNRESDHGANVSLVYTPPELRGRGYAGCVVAHLSQQLLDAGYEFCTLYTDASNPASNALYPKLGYEFVEDGGAYEFLAAP